MLQVLSNGLVMSRTAAPTSNPNLAVLYQRYWICNHRRVRIVARLKADIRISLKQRGGPTYRIELVRQPMGRRFWVRRDGTWSDRVPEAIASQIAQHIRRWLVGCL